MNNNHAKWIPIAFGSLFGLIFLCFCWCIFYEVPRMRGQYWSWKQCERKDKVKPEEKTEEVFEEEGGAD